VSEAARISVVVEWDNVRLAGASRARSMLARLRDELLVADARGYEVLLVHDGRPGDVAEARRTLATSGASVRVISAPGSGYYELKNVGAREARGHFVAFLDCDIVPEPGWLPALIAPFADPKVGVVAGATHLDTDGFWGRCNALASVFPLRPLSGPAEPTTTFSANSVAFRREIALAFPFPSIPGTSRASCVALSRRLAEADVSIVLSPSAHAEHPAPIGVRRAIVRALVHGRDTAVLADLGDGPRPTVRRGLGRVSQLMVSAIRDRRRLGLSLGVTPFALIFALAYYALVGAGAAYARAAPAAARRLDL
jgi:hypothetical protein